MSRDRLQAARYHAETLQAVEVLYSLRNFRNALSVDVNAV